VSAVSPQLRLVSNEQRTQLGRIVFPQNLLSSFGLAGRREFLPRM
jgi:hypothetical protein